MALTPSPESPLRSSAPRSEPIGTAVAQQSLRSVLSFCNSPQMTAPEAYIQFTPGMITDEGEVTVETTEAFLRNYIAAILAFIARVAPVLPREASGRGLEHKGRNGRTQN